MSGCKSKHSKSFANEIEKTTLNDLSKSCNTFNRHDLSKCVDHVKSNAFGSNSLFVCTKEQIRKEFRRLNPRNSQDQMLFHPKS